MIGDEYVLGEQKIHMFHSVMKTVEIFAQNGTVRLCLFTEIVPDQFLL